MRDSLGLWPFNNLIVGGSRPSPTADYMAL